MSYPYDVGDFHRPITTSEPEAQIWFDRGLIWIYNFDLEMAGRCFREAIALDDDCAMAYWGLAYSSGIYYNKPWHRMQKNELAEKLQRCHDASRAAKERCGSVTEVEAMMIDALQARFQSPSPVAEAEYHRWGDDHADVLDLGPYFLGEDYSLCDILFLMQATWTENQPPDLKAFPNSRRMMQITFARPAFQRVMAIHEIEQLTKI